MAFRQVWNDCSCRPDYLCAVCCHHHHLLHLLLLLFVQDVPPTTSSRDYHHGHHSGTRPLPATSKCATQLSRTDVPGLPFHALPASDASCTLPDAVPTTLPSPAHGSPRLPRNNGWRCGHALPCQSASLQSGLRGSPEGSSLSTPLHLWLPLDLSCVYVNGYAGTVLFLPVRGVCVLFVHEVSCEGWGTILPRVNWDHSLFPS